jgi:hypothetical protein
LVAADRGASAGGPYSLSVDRRTPHWTSAHRADWRPQDTPEILNAIVSDVDTAKTSVLMEFYIWNEG